MKLARKKGKLVRNDVMELLHLSPNQAYRVLKRMVDGHLLVMQGSRKGAVYELASEDFQMDEDKG